MTPPPLTIAEVHAWAAKQIEAGHGAAPVVLQRVVEQRAYVQPLRFTLDPSVGQRIGAPAVCVAWAAGALVAVESGAVPLWASS